MAFFSAKNAGLAFMIAAIISIISAIIVVAGYMDNVAYGVVLAIGAIIGALLYFMYGNKVRTGAISEKIEILAQFVKIVGVVTIIDGIFTGIAPLLNNAGADFVALIGGIILGLIIIFISTKINDGKQTTGDKLIWIILLIAFVICLILAILAIVGGCALLVVSILGGIGVIIGGICDLIIYSFMILMLTDSEVKSEMGI